MVFLTKTSGLMTLVDKSEFRQVRKSRIIRDFFFGGLLVLGACNEPVNTTESVLDPIDLERIQLTGEAQGTTFSIIYYDSLERNFSADIDSILGVMDDAFSNYIASSLISRLNKTDTFVSSANFGFLNAHFFTLLTNSNEVSVLTNYAFNTTVYPLVQYWGFGPDMEDRVVDSVAIDSLLKLVGQQPDVLMTGYLEGPMAVHKNRGVQLDFNAIAQGYSVDIIAEFLASKGVSSYMIELGGEILTSGTKPNGSGWKLGVDKPVPPDEERALQVILEITDKALATSGSYRKFYENNGIRYSHTIDPRTGYPVQHSLLSVTVVANECWKADAYATAFMVMGLDVSKQFIAEHTELELDAYFIYDNGVGEFLTEMTPGFERYITD